MPLAGQAVLTEILEHEPQPATLGYAVVLFSITGSYTSTLLPTSQWFVWRPSPPLRGERMIKEWYALRTGKSAQHSIPQNCYHFQSKET